MTCHQTNILSKAQSTIHHKKLLRRCSILGGNVLRGDKHVRNRCTRSSLVASWHGVHPDRKIRICFIFLSAGRGRLAELPIIQGLVRSFIQGAAFAAVPSDGR